VNSNPNRCREALFIDVTVTVDSTFLMKQRVSLRGVFEWDVNSTETKHSGYFV